MVAWRTLLLRRLLACRRLLTGRWLARGIIRRTRLLADDFAG
jgi:hypothetical protein